ncbi:DUF4214 domain-containing protein [Pseudoduganella albidiflava]|uniref:DUF4214 domain-containing protein n=1 Tax=Pseudoduganella albidiflava TaxID=321983 RepID=A0A411WVH4_9BURK|nr:DUF4214 domain-containing protein [Pseudoduganella albidiflava]QBI00612.1 DUF4214 domain-containing protein [Pseudoduganella albidiflava]GGY31990.1 hypothetical protein GCM10007387_12640 [Pseudoduganella albidiflava]
MSSETTQFSAVLDGEHQYYRPRLPYLFGQDNDNGYSAIWYGPDIVAVDQTDLDVLYNYATEVLTPTVSGNYTLTVDSAVGLVADGRSDTQIWLYDTTFDPDRPLDNIIAANEDIDFRDENDQPVNWLSHLPNMPLIAGHTYVMVVTTYAADATGSANFSAIGPGELLLGELPPDPTAPVVESVGVPAPGAYSSGEHLDFTVTFSETVLVDTNSGTPALGLVIGGQTVQALYAEGSGTATLTFRYTLVGGLEDADGIDVTDLALHGGTIRDIADNEADITLQAVGDTTGVLVDTAAPSVVAVAVPAAATYAQGGQLNFTVTLDEAVIVDTSGGTPRLALVIGSTTVYANYVSGSGTTALLFRHTLATNRSDNDGITIGALSGNGGTLKDAAGNDAALALQGVASTSGVLVDTFVPSITGDISVPAAGSYRAGQTLTFTVTFDENVIVTGTDSTLGLTIGSTARSATFASKNQNSITYTYTVQAGENDTNGIAVTTLSAGTGTIRDAAGNDAALTLFRHVPSTASILVDTRAPAVTSVAVPPNGAHGTGTALDFTVTFDENMTVTGTDGTLELTIGGAARSAAFVSSTARTVTYRYVVQAGDNDADGIVVSAIGTGTGTIRDAAGNHAALSLTGKVPPTAGIVVDTQAPVVAVVTVPQDGAHGVGAQLDFTVTFNENVTVAGTDGTLALTIGGAARSAAFLSSTGNTVTYRYTLQAGDHDADGIAVGALGTGTGTIRDAAGNHATLSLAGQVPPTAGITVDTRAPAVSGMTVPADGTRAAGTALGFTVAFDENVVVTGTDGTLGLNVGGTARNATYLSSTGNTITYRYLVQPGDDDADGIELGAIGTGSGAIRDAAGNHAALSLAGHMPPTGGITVDGRAPVVTSLTVPADGVYPDNTAFMFTVTFDEPVFVGDAGAGAGSFLQLTIGEGRRHAAFVSSSGNSITYRYYVSADFDSDGITVDLLSAGSATIRDAAGNDAILSLAGHIPPTSGIHVDTAMAQITSVTVPQDGTYVTGDALDFAITFDEVLTVTDSASRLILTIGGVVRYAAFLSHDVDTVSYRYIVQAGDKDADGIEVGELDFDATTILDPAGNQVGMYLAPEVPSTAGIVVETQAPVVSSVTLPQNGTHGAGAHLDITIAFDENVTVTGTDGTLALTIGGTARSATFVSSTGNTITYRYIVQAGDSDADGIAIGAIDTGTGTIRDTAGNDAALSLDGHVPSTAGVLVDARAPVVSGLTVPQSGSHGVGAQLDFTVAFDENVTVTGTDGTLALTIGGAARNAAFLSSTGNTITYRYTVQAGDGANGITIDAIGAGTGTIRDGAGNDATLSLAGHVPPTGGIVVDTQAPAVAGMSVPQGGSHGVGAQLDFTVTFDENVTVTGTDGSLALTIGGAARNAAFLSSTGNTVTYRYTVQAGDNDADGIAVGALGTGTGAIRDAAGNHAALSLTGHVPPTGGIFVDTQAPVVSGMVVPSDGTHAAGAVLDFTVSFDSTVVVTGTDGTLELTIGGAARSAAFVSSTGNSVTYRYTVQPGDHDADGIAIGAIDTGTGTIRDAAGNHAVLSLTGQVPSTAGITVDTQAPAVTGVVLPQDGAHTAGAVLDFTVVFDASVTVTGTDGSLALDIGGTARNAAFLSSTGSTVTYRYTVQAGDNDADGIGVGAIGLGSGTIRDAAGNDAVLSLAGQVPSTAGIVVDARAPVVTGVTVPQGGSHGAGEHLDFTVAFDEDVSIAGTDGSLALDIGGTARNAVFLSSTGNTVTYRYTVQAGDGDADGIGIGTIGLGNGTIRDAAGNDAVLSLAGHEPPTGGIVVDTRAPVVTGLTVPQGGIRGAGEHLDFTVAFDEDVTVAGTDGSLALTIGGGLRNAAFLSSTGNTVTYRYTVQAGDSDADGIDIGALGTGTGTIRDAAGNDAALSLTGHVPSTGGIVVDAQAAAVTGVTVPQGGVHGIGAQLDFTVAFGDAVIVTGTDGTLGLTVGGAARSAVFLSSTGNTITYRYTVQAGDNDADGIAVGAIDTGTGTIRDAAGNDAALSLAGHLPPTDGVTVDTRAPAVSGITVPQSGIHGSGTQCDFTIAFDEAVIVTGTDSTLAVTVGGTARAATFVASTGNTVTYRYTVQAGDNDADGIAIGALALGTSTIRDAAGNDASLALPGQLPSTGGILVDTQAPAVIGVAVPGNGVYGTGTQLVFTVAFGENVTVGGTGSTLDLAIGGTARSAQLLSSSGNTLTYRYTVQAGDGDADGIAVLGIALHGGTLRDAAGNDAALDLAGHLPPLGGVLVDTTVPPPLDTQAPSVAIVGIPANGTYAVGGQLEFAVSFDENVIVTGTGSTLGLMVGGTARAATFVSASGNTVTYRYTVQAGDTDADGIAIGALALGASTIRDAAGNDAVLALAGHVPPLDGVLVEGSVPDTVAPAFAGATVNRRTLVLTYDEAGPLDAAHGPATGAFTVMAGGTAIAVSAVAVDAAARTVTLTLATAVRHDQPVTVAYADPTGGNDAAAIQDAAGNDAAPLAATPVVNTTLPPVDPPPVDPPPVDPPPVDPPPVDPPPVDPPPVDPPPVDPPPVDPPPVDPPPADPLIDGLVVRTVVTTRGDGSVSQVVTVPVVTSTRVEQVGDRERADIPLVKSAAGTSLLTAQVPLGFGLEASGVARPAPVAAALTDLVREIRAHTADGSADQAQLTRAGSGYIDSLDDAAALLVHTLVPTAARNAAPGTLVISGAPEAAGQAPTALVIDARALPPGSSIALHDVEFAVVVGPVRVISGTGAQVVWSDSAAQDIMLGEGDDVLHGGGGNDIVGSGSGNDMVFGDAGNDVVFGGQGNDTVDGGSGNDTVQLAGAGRGEYGFRVVDGGLVATHRDGGADGTDMIRGVETLRFTGADMSVAGTATRLVEALAGKQASVATLDAMVRMAEEGAGLSRVADALYGQFGAAELDDAAFVGQLYRNAFDRVPDSQGLAFWVGYLASGTARSDVALGIANSAEKLAMPAEVAFHATDVAVIVRLYDVLFDRAPDAAGLNHWIGAHEGGMSMMDIADAFMASSESMALHGAMSDAQFTGALYRNGLHREAADGEASYWLDALASGGADRGDVLLGFADAAEVIALAGTMSTTIAML